MKSRVKRVGVAFLEIYYKKEFLETVISYESKIRHYTRECYC